VFKPTASLISCELHHHKIAFAKSLLPSSRRISTRLIHEGASSTKRHLKQRRSLAQRTLCMHLISTRACQRHSKELLSRNLCSVACYSAADTSIMLSRQQRIPRTHASWPAGQGNTGLKLRQQTKHIPSLHMRTPVTRVNDRV
jgi:hypothetical protein